MENEVGGGLCFLFRFSRRVEEGSSIFVALWLLQNSGGPCALICIGRSFPRLPLAPMRINRLPLTSPFRRRAVSPPRNRLLRIQHSPFIGGYGGCCRQQTDIKVIKGRRIPRRERLIAFLGPGAAPSSLDISLFVIGNQRFRGAALFYCDPNNRPV